MSGWLCRHIYGAHTAFASCDLSEILHILINIDLTVYNDGIFSARFLFGVYFNASV